MYGIKLARFLGIASLFALLTPSHSVTTFNAEHRLHDEIFKKRNYYKNIRPIKDVSKPLEVSFGASLQAVNNVDPEAETITLLIWLNYEWKDFQLPWNISDYEGLMSTSLPPSKIWIPDIVPYNALVHDTNIVQEGGTWPVIYSDGTVSWVPPASLEASCIMDMSDFPNDRQTCGIKFGSWTYDGSKINITSRHTHIDISTYAHSREWELISAPMQRTVATYECCPEPYIDITFTLELRRRDQSVKVTVVVPAVVFMFLLPVVFLFPPDSSQKTTLACTIMIGLVLMLQLVMSYIPVGHATLPKVAKYYLGCLLMTALSIGCSALIAALWDYGRRRVTMSSFLKAILDIASKVFCVRPETFLKPGGDPQAPGQADDETAGGDQLWNKEDSHVQAAQWRQLATVCDRLCFVLFFIILLIMCITWVA